MELAFNNNIAEFRAESHFNLHLEGAGSVSLFRRTSGNGWDFISNLNGEVMDMDVAVTIPKDYRITCTAIPTMAVVTFSE